MFDIQCLSKDPSNDGQVLAEIYMTMTPKQQEVTSPSGSVAQHEIRGDSGYEI